ncbi:hypothetical protein [Streptomyces sp. NPDC059371]|uniref:hypothetical protein n=1 Tax=Streptomyces sp. NPDC059371 TaxID=3346812 RepID=UPI0036972C3F
MRITAVIDGVSARITPHGPIEYDTLPALRGAVVDLPLEVTEVVWDLSDTSPQGSGAGRG